MFKRYFSLPLIIFSTILLSLFLCFPLLIICLMGSCSCSRRSSEREGGSELIHSFLGPAHIVELSSVLFLLPCFFLWDLGSGFCFLLLHLRSPFESLFCCCSFFKKKKKERKKKDSFVKKEGVDGWRRRKGWGATTTSTKGAASQHLLLHYESTSMAWVFVISFFFLLFFQV